jgi:hypothetical protein
MQALSSAFAGCRLGGEAAPLGRCPARSSGSRPAQLVVTAVTTSRERRIRRHNILRKKARSLRASRTRL